MGTSKLKRVATICARGGSKGVPGKNLRMLGGSPLVAHSVRHAAESDLFDCIVISSDSDAILAAGISAGASLAILRPDELASDAAGKVPAIVHAVAEAEARTSIRFDTVVDLDATSPLRDVSDITATVALVEQHGAPSAITGCPARRSPYFNLVEVAEDGSVALSKQLPAAVLCRQDCPQAFDMNASVYAWQRDMLMESGSVFLPGTRLHAMPEERSHDIDTETDLAIVSLLWSLRHGAA